MVVLVATKESNMKTLITKVDVTMQASIIPMLAHSVEEDGYIKVTKLTRASDADQHNVDTVMFNDKINLQVMLAIEKEMSK